jgi:hypothetical protein
MTNMFRSYAKVKLLLSLGAFFLPLLMGGCKQNSIFDDISWETAPTEPQIQGAPSKMVEANIDNKNRLYVANGLLWEYDPSASNASWSRIAGPFEGGFVADVASTTNNGASALYALTLDNTSTRVWKGASKTNNEIKWTEVNLSGDYRFIQNIFGAGDTLFATGGKNAGNDYDYAILYCKQSDTSFSSQFLIDTGKSPLIGAGKVGNEYYLATSGKGIYKADDTNISGISPLASAPLGMAGFLQTQDSQAQDIIIGVSKDGITVHIDSSGVTVNPASLGGTYTGALALMDNPDPTTSSFDKLLLLGYMGSSSSYRHGYVEVQFNSADGTHDGTARIPGANPPSSITDDGRKDQQYTSSLRRYPVKALWVLQDQDPKVPSVIFAATTNEGLYSYRERSDGGWQWNHEEE